MKKLLLILGLTLVLSGCSHSSTTTPLIEPITETETAVTETCTWPTTVTIENKTLIDLGMPALDGGAQMEFQFDENQKIIAASSLLGFSTGPDFVRYTFADESITSAQFIAEGFMPVFDENDSFTGFDYTELFTIQDSTFEFQEDGTVQVLHTVEPEADIIEMRNSPTEPYNEWFTHHWTSMDEFFELWKEDFCQTGSGNTDA